MLTPAEKKAGRAFRDICQARLGELPADATCPPYIVWFRHACSARADDAGTWAMPLRQHYWTSPEYWVCYCSAIQPFVKYVFPHEDCQGGKPVAEAGKFAFIFRRGECPRCHLTVCSGSGRFVLAASHPPEKGAVVASQQPHGHVSADQGAAAPASRLDG